MLRRIQKWISWLLSLFFTLASPMNAQQPQSAQAQYTVSFTAQGESLCGTMTDADGHVTAIDGGTAHVAAGEYTFCVGEDCRRTEGEVSVSADCRIDVELPQGNWFRSVALLDANKKAYPAQYGENTAVVSVPDYVGSAGVYLYAQMGDVPDSTQTRLRACYVGNDGVDKSEISRSWHSQNVSLTALLSEGMQGKSFTLEAFYTDARGYTQVQTYALQAERVPTLSALSVLSDGVNILSDFARDTEEYTVPCVSERVQIIAVADYPVLVDGGTDCTVDNDGEAHTVTVSAQGKEKTYTIRLEKKDSVQLTLLPPQGAEVQLQTADGQTLTPVSPQVYRVIPGVRYQYVAEKDDLYGVCVPLTLTEDAVVQAQEPLCTDALSDFRLYDRSGAAVRCAYVPDEPFAAGNHRCTFTVSDTAGALYAQATAAEGYTVCALYRAQSADGAEKAVEIGNTVSDTGAATYLALCLARTGCTQTVCLRLSRWEGETQYYQQYTVVLRRELHLSALEVLADGQKVPLRDADGSVVSFDRDVTAYDLHVSETVSQLTLSAACADAHYTCTVNGERMSENHTVSTDSETIEICVYHKDPLAKEKTYTLRIVRQTTVRLRFSTVPENACVFLVHERDGKSVALQDGSFPVCSGEQYTYTVTANGYVGKKVSFTAPQTDSVLAVTLEKAPEADTLPDFDAQWPSFRADAYNNGVTAAKTPVSAEETVLYWAKKLGDGTESQACGCPILVDGCVYTYAGTTLYKLDAASGAILQTGQMDHASGFALNTPTYAAGMLFVALADGTVQAFHAQTLEPLWIYRDALGGQPNSPIVYADGYIYTGFWLGETQDANFVCLSVTDEDPTRQDEEKLPSWIYTHTGGFYWSGAYVTDNFMLVATDDGETGYAKGYARLLSLDPHTGTLLDSVTMPLPGDIRSGVMFDPQTDACYFTSKGGWFGKIRVSADGTADRGSLQCLPLQNGSTDGSPAMSTSTPTVCGGRAYIGVSGSSQFGNYSGHNITVIDLVRMEVAYTVPVQGYPQSSAMLTTAYDSGDGTVYVYFFDNCMPGKLRILRDKPGQTKAQETVTETYVRDGKTYTCAVAPVLFTPCGAHAQYTVCSPIADENGTIYFKNDTGYLFALGSAPTRLTVTAQPDKLTYRQGETFDPSGMQVTASFANGTVRDVTNYVTWSKAALCADDTEFQLRLPYVLYHDGAYGAGTAFPEPAVTLSLQILPQFAAGDVDGDGSVTVSDADLVYACHNALCTLTPEQLLRADMNGDGRINALDAALLYALVRQQGQSDAALRNS